MPESSRDAGSVPPWSAGCMSTDDKIHNKGDDLRGKVKEGIGRATGDEELEAQGRGDQAAADLKQAGEKIKDVFKH